MSWNIETIEWLKQHWDRLEGLGVILLALGVIWVTVGGLAGVSGPWILLILFLECLAVATFWGIKRQPSKTRKGRIGIAVALSAEPGVSSTIRADFIQALRKHIQASPSAAIFQLILVPNYISAKTFTRQDADRLRMKIRAHFMVWGTVRNRTIKGEERTILDVSGLVTHAPLPSEQSQKIAREFSELMPSRYDMRSADSFPAIELTASWTGLIAQYIMGLAAAMSGDLKYAEAQFKEVSARLSVANEGFLFYTKLRDRIPRHLNEIAFFQCRECLKRWYQTKDGDVFAEVSARLVEADQNGFDGDNWRFLRAIAEFARSRSTAESRRLLATISKKKRDAIWHLNMAFLDAYDGDLKLATRHYRKAAEIGIPSADVDVIVGQVEHWLLWQVEEEPGKFELHYCLGFINLHFKGDSVQAKADFERFLANCSHADHEPAQRLVRQWMSQLEQDAAQPA